MSARAHWTYTISSTEYPETRAIVAMLYQASEASSSKVPSRYVPSGASGGIALMKQRPLTSPAKLNGRPAGRSGPDVVRLIVNGGQEPTERRIDRSVDAVCEPSISSTWR